MLFRSDVRFLGFEERTIDGDRAALVAALAAVLDEVGPQEVFLPSRYDGHVDHVVCNETARRALAGRGVAPACYEYPVWFWESSSWARPGAAPWHKAFDVVAGPVSALRRSTVYRIPLGPHAAAKAAAVAAYRSQTTKLTGEPGWATLDRRFLRHFLERDELFLAVGVDPDRSDG